MKNTPTLVGQLTAVPLERPCDQDWSAMRGDDRVRHCTACARDVHDLSAMTELQAELVLLNAGTSQPCIRFLRDPDGSVQHLPALPSGLLSSRPPRALVAAAVGITLGAGALHAEEPKQKAAAPEQCVAYVSQADIDGAPIVASAEPRPAAAHASAKRAAGPSAAGGARADTTPAAAPESPPRPMHLAGGPRAPQTPVATGTLQMKSKVPREVTIVGLKLKAPFESYLLSPRDFVADVRDPNGKVRKVKFSIKPDKLTVIDLDRP